MSAERLFAVVAGLSLFAVTGCSAFIPLDPPEVAVDLEPAGSRSPIVSGVEARESAAAALREARARVARAVPRAQAVAVPTYSPATAERPLWLASGVTIVPLPEGGPGGPSSGASSFPAEVSGEDAAGAGGEPAAEPIVPPTLSSDDAESEAALRRQQDAAREAEEEAARRAAEQARQDAAADDEARQGGGDGRATRCGGGEGGGRAAQGRRGGGGAEARGRGGDEGAGDGSVGVARSSSGYSVGHAVGGGCRDVHGVHRFGDVLVLGRVRGPGGV